jgi:menaquinone-dependent protoporphyrinogen oxidase
MNILIAFASGYGTTQEIALKVGQVLAEEPSFNVSVESIEQVAELEGYDAIVLASSVRANQPLVSLTDFLAQNRHQLAKKKLSLFMVCLMANCVTCREQVKGECRSMILEKYPELHYISSEVFGGKIDFDKLNPVMQMLMERVLEKTGISTKGSVDTRDWNFIVSWAQELRGKLVAA